MAAKKDPAGELQSSGVNRRAFLKSTGKGVFGAAAVGALFAKYGSSLRTGDEQLKQGGGSARSRDERLKQIAHTVRHHRIFVIGSMNICCIMVLKL